MKAGYYAILIWILALPTPIKTILESLKAVHYAIWSLILMLPMPIKILVELGMLLLAAALFWFVLRYVLFALSKVLLVLNVIILGGFRKLLGVFGRKEGRTYVLDDKIGQTGRQIDQWLRQKGKDVTKIYFFQNLKKKIGVVIAVFVIIYLAAILPVFKLEKVISGYYVEHIYCVNRALGGLEHILTKEKDKYPALIQLPEKEPEEESPAAEEIDGAEEPAVCLEIKEELLQANVRDSASMNGTSICVISTEDQIVYLNDCQYAEDRYWLRVSIPTKDNIEGWVSEHVIREDLVEALNLP